jgi:ankyrin repeat protein
VRTVRIALIACCIAGTAALPGAAEPRTDPRLPVVLASVKSGEVQALKAALATSADVNATEADGSTALHWAAHRNDVQAVDLLIRAGAHVNVRNRYGVTPIALAAENGAAAVIGRLLKAGASANDTLADGETILMTASRAGDVAAVDLLLAAGADVNAAERWRKQTALMWAAADNNAATMRRLLGGGADPRARSEAGFTAMLFAARGGHLEAADVLLASGVDVNDALPDGTTALVLAVINAHFEFAAHVVERGADPNAAAQGWTALHQLAWTRRPNRGFANPGPSPTGSLDSLALVKVLAAHGANLNARETKEPRDGYRNLLNRTGATPFLLAAKAADVDLMRALVEQGADPLLTTADGTTPLMAAAGVGIWAVGESPGTNDDALAAVKLALDLGGDVNAVNEFGYTALHGAAHRGASEIVRLLADRGARLDVKLTKTGGGALGWKEGWTPLEIAEGLFYANTFKRYPETAALLRQLLKDRGLSPVGQP